MTRLQTMNLGNVGDTDSTPIQLTQLDLVSCEPIEVLIDHLPTLWDVEVTLNPDVPLPPPGLMEVRKTHANGGTFDASFNVLPRFTFTEVGNPSNQQFFDAPDPDFLRTIVSASWVHDTGGEISPVCGVNFVPGIEHEDIGINTASHLCCTDVCHNGATATHCIKHTVCAPCPHGACCNPADGSCAVVDEVDCMGEYKGHGTTCSDRDGDGIADILETNSCCDPTRNECRTGTDPNNPDTDGDGLLDGYEVHKTKCDPCVYDSVDTDGDLIPDDCGEVHYVKFSQPPMDTSGTEDYPSDIDWVDMVPNQVAADDFISDGRPITAVRWWGSNLQNEAKPGIDVAAGVDLWHTPAGASHQDFTGTPIPAGFFDDGILPDGSDMFTSIVDFEGVPLGASPSLGETDTIVRRLAAAPMPNCPNSAATVPIEIIALSLQSTSPITVTYNGGGNPEFWDVRVFLANGAQQQGDMTIQQQCTGGGSYNATLRVDFKAVFTRQGDGLVREFDTIVEGVGPTVFTSAGNWVYQPDAVFGATQASPGTQVDTDGDGLFDIVLFDGSSNFFPGFEQTNCTSCKVPPGGQNKPPLTPEQAQWAAHGVNPANKASCNGPPGFPCGGAGTQCGCFPRPDGGSNCADLNSCIQSCLSDAECQNGTKCFLEWFGPGTGCCARNCSDFAQTGSAAPSGGNQGGEGVLDADDVVSFTAVNPPRPSLDADLIQALWGDPPITRFDDSTLTESPVVLSATVDWEQMSGLNTLIKESARQDGPQPIPVEIEGGQLTPADIMPDGGLSEGAPVTAAPPLTNSFQGTIDDGTFIPPDTHGAVGPQHIVEILNSGFTIYDRNGGVVAPQITLQAFWSALGVAPGMPASTPFDPKILYDQYSERWVVTADGNPNNRDGTNTSWVLVGISQTNSPTGFWNLYAIQANVGAHLNHWSDYPGLGVDPNNVIITNNMFTVAAAPGFVHADVWVIDKASLIAGAGPLVFGVDYALFHDPCGFGGFTFQPCHTFGQTSVNATNYLLNEGWWDTATTTRRFLLIYPITGVGAAAVLNCPGGGNNFIEVAGYNLFQLNAPQPNCATAISTNDTRLINAVTWGNTIWTTHSVGTGVVGVPAPASRTEVSWYEINPALAGPFPGGAPNQQGRVAHTTRFYYFPSVAVNKDQCVALGFSGSDAATFASGYYTARFPTDPAGTMQPVNLLKAGVAPYLKTFGAGANRWGDYSATVLDPRDLHTFWTVQEYAEAQFGGAGAGACVAEQGRWGTWWGKFQCEDSIDGWFISFHEHLQKNDPQDTPLALYYCDVKVVDIDATKYPDCQDHRVFEYMVNLDLCCLVHARADYRSDHWPAKKAAFYEEKGVDYHIDIQAVVGHKYVQDKETGDCIEYPTGKGAVDHFWGWHTTPINNYLKTALQTMVGMGPFGEWFYGPWLNVAPKCDFPNMSFELLTNIPTPYCKEKCCQCAPGSHWIDGCGSGNDQLKSRATVVIDTNPLSCVGNTALVLDGPVSVEKIGPLDDSVRYPGTRSVDLHLDVIDTEIRSMTLVGGGVILRAGEGMGQAAVLKRSFGVIAEQALDSFVADSFFDVFFEVDLGGGNYYYNHNPHRLGTPITCVPPNEIYQNTLCLPLFDRPRGDPSAVHVANLVSAQHDPFADLCGNGVVNPGEDCDPPGSIGQCPGGAACMADCTCPPPVVVNDILWDPATSPGPWPNNNPEAATRALRFRVTGPASPIKLDAIKVTMVDLQHPNPRNLPNRPPPNFTAFDTLVNGTCSGGQYAGHHCDVDSDCAGVPPGTCSGLSGCSAAGEGNGCARWVGRPSTFYETQGPPQSGPYRASRLQCTPFYWDWKSEELGGRVTVIGAEIVPSSEYSVEAYASTCAGGEATCTDVSAPVTMYTRRCGDVDAQYNPPSFTNQPDAIDVAQVVNKFKGLAGSPDHYRAQVQANLPELNSSINALDIVAVVDQLKGLPYAFSGPCVCPSTQMCGLSCAGCAGMCVKTCIGGDNDGEPCINNSHCPGGVCNPIGTCRDRCGRCN